MGISELEELRIRIRQLEAENTELRGRLKLRGGISSLREGSRGERIIAQLLGGILTSHSAPHDVFVEHAGLKLEVKFSHLGTPMKTSKCRRWSWNHPLGLYDGKDFHRLILIGIIDERFRHLYRDHSSDYVVFDLDPQHVRKIMRKDKMIQITTSPRGAWGATARILFGSCQTTLDELKCKYGLSERETTK